MHSSRSSSTDTPDLAARRATQRGAVGVDLSTQMIEQARAEAASDDGVRIPGAHWLVTARRATGGPR